MRFSPNTLNSVIAVLSVDKVTNITPDQLNAALQALTGEQNTSPDLQPGEIYISKHENEERVEEHVSREGLEEYLRDAFTEENEHSSYTRDLDDFMTVWVVRRELTLKSKQAVEVTIS